MISKAHISTADGQRALCADADSRATAFQMAAFLRRKGIQTYDDCFISTCNQTTLAAIKEELRQDYNRAVSER